MRKNRWFYMIMFLLGLFSVSSTGVLYAAETTDYSSLTEKTLEIASEEELISFRDKVNSGSAFEGYSIYLTNDITLSKDWTEAIGNTKETPFKGYFDGQGHTISGIHINREENCPDDCSANKPYYTYSALFGIVKNGSIRDLITEGNIHYIYHIPNKNSNYNYHYRYVAGVVGIIENGSLEGCSNRVGIVAQGSQYTGGIAGLTEHTPITDCMNFGIIQEGRDSFEGVTYSGGYVGGICGDFNTNFNTKDIFVERCSNYGNIISNSPEYQYIDTGGHGSTTGVPVVGDYPTVKAGGIIGFYGNGQSEDTPGYVKDCANKGNIYGHMETAGGIVGWYGGGRKSSLPLILQNCYNLGDITGTADGKAINMRLNLGGLLGNPDFGRDYVEIQNCYSTGTVSKTSNSTATIGDLYPSTASFVTTTNSYGPSDIKAMDEGLTSEIMGKAYQDDVHPVQFGYPLLSWETADPGSASVEVKFVMDPEDASVSVYDRLDKKLTLEASAPGVYNLTPGLYLYSIAKKGYLTQEETFYVSNTRTVSIHLEESDERLASIFVDPVPQGLSLVVENFEGRNMAAENQDNGVFTYLLRQNQDYYYQISAPDYVSQEGTFHPSKDLKISLTKSLYNEDAPENYFIYGNGNSGKTHTITKGGTFYIGEGATGTMTIDTTEAVTLVGKGIADANLYKNLFINCKQAKTKLTLQDVGIQENSSLSKLANLMDFTGKGNVMTIEGVCLLDYDYGFTEQHDALIHVPIGASLTVNGSGTLYQYNCTQGAGFGGDTGEMNGDIAFALTGSAFVKGTRQGAVIGAGASAKGSGIPGSIMFQSGTYNIETNSRGAAIGGSAGSGGASSGTEVYVKGGSININCDYTGSAVGGGGYVSGNDASGGTVYITGGSLRTYIDKNAASNEYGGFNNAAFTEGINDAVITAERKNADGENVYKCVFDTTELGDGPYTVQIDGKDFYTGGRHEYAYVNEALSKNEGAQINVTRTQDNWIPNEEPNLYFYLTGEDHTITVGDRTYQATFDPDVLDADGNVKDNRVYTIGAFTVKAVEAPAPELAVTNYTDVDGADSPAEVTFSDSGTDFTVQSKEACTVMLVKADGTVQTLKAAKAGDAYAFSVEGAAEGDRIAVALKGDTNLNGVVDLADSAMAKASYLGRLTLNEQQAAAANVNNSDEVGLAEAALIKAAYLGKYTMTW